MDAIAEGQVPPGVLALHPDVLALVEHALVAVSRGVPERDPIVLPDLLSEQFGVFSRGSAHMRQGRLPTDDFVHRVDGQFRRVFLLRNGALIGILVEAPGIGTHRIAGCVVAAYLGTASREVFRKLLWVDHGIEYRGHWP